MSIETNLLQCLKNIEKLGGRFTPKNDPSLHKEGVKVWWKNDGLGNIVSDDDEQIQYPLQVSDAWNVFIYEFNPKTGALCNSIDTKQ